MGPTGPEGPNSGSGVAVRQTPDDHPARTVAQPHRGRKGIARRGLREFRADVGGARYAGTENMIAALERLKGGVAPMPDGMKAMGIGNGGMMALFSTHPPLDVRIAALRANRG